MDKVQIYYAALLITNIFLGGLMHGKPRKDTEYSAWTTIVGLIIGLPVIGRIFGWW